MVKLYLHSCNSCSVIYAGLCSEPGRVAYNVSTIKWGTSSFTRTVWCFCKYVFLIKESASDNSNESFELRRVVLVCVSPITNADMVMFTWHNA